MHASSTSSTPPPVLQVDGDGDGIVDQEIQPDASETDETDIDVEPPVEPPADKSARDVTSLGRGRSSDRLAPFRVATLPVLDAEASTSPSHQVEGNFDSHVKSRQDFESEVLSIETVVVADGVTAPEPVPAVSTIQNSEGVIDSPVPDQTASVYSSVGSGRGASTAFTGISLLLILIVIGVIAFLSCKILKSK